MEEENRTSYGSRMTEENDFKVTRMREKTKIHIEKINNV